MNRETVTTIYKQNTITFKQNKNIENKNSDLIISSVKVTKRRRVITQIALQN